MLDSTVRQPHLWILALLFWGFVWSWAGTFLNLSFPACKISIVKNVLPRIIVITEWNNIVAFAFILVKKHSRGNIMELKLPPCLQPWMNLAEQTIWGPQCVHYSRDAWMQWHSPCSVGLHSLAGEESAQRSRVSGIVTPCLWCHSLWSKGFFFSVFHLTEWKQCGSLSVCLLLMVPVNHSPFYFT